MVKIYSTGSIFDYPRRHKKLVWYVEILCSRLLKLKQISEEDIKRFWDEVRSKQQELPFPWQRDNLAKQAGEHLEDLLSGYKYDSVTRVYKRN
jgi:hypothetical protein